MTRFLTSALAWLIVPAFLGGALYGDQIQALVATLLFCVGTLVLAFFWNALTKEAAHIYMPLAGVLLCATALLAMIAGLVVPHYGVLAAPLPMALSLLCAWRSDALLTQIYDDSILMGEVITGQNSEKAEEAMKRLNSYRNAKGLRGLLFRRANTAKPQPKDAADADKTADKPSDTEKPNDNA